MREILRLVVVLSIICAVAGFSLALVHKVTKAQIDYQQVKFVKEPAVKRVLTGYDNDPIKDRKELEIGKDKYGRPQFLLVFPAKKEGKTFALAMETYGKGYHGDEGVMVGIDVESGKLTGIGITSHSETPGIGAKAVEPSFTDQFKDIAIQEDVKKKSDGGKIEALSGATLTTNGVLSAVNSALKYYKELKDKLIS
ncbi:MAG: RnfABCDGE type electron transport complex subunit G [Deltaproteobacteria bacterium]|nr:RnfABCDGE type electron transport complex subunit G [Deltaproteobacteria bacterium]